MTNENIKCRQDPVDRPCSININDLIDFESFCGQAEGRSNKTIELTTLAIRKLRDFLLDKNLPTDARAIGPNEIRAFTLHLKEMKKSKGHPYTKPQEQALSPHSINSYLRAMRAAWNRWVAEGLVESSPFTKVKIPRTPKKAMRTFSEGELELLFSAIDRSTAEGFRDYTLLNVYLDTMARLSEITELQMVDVDLKGRCMKVLGKGQKERVVPFGIKVQKLLWQYIRMYRPSPLSTQGDYLFLTRDGRPLTKNRVEAIMRKYVRKAGIRGTRCSPHTLRHSGCLQWIRNRGDLFTLQQITGHSSLTVLRGYINLDQSDIRTAHQQYSPVDNLHKNLRR
jgi:integrase/recombinase XerD